MFRIIAASVCIPIWLVTAMLYRRRRILLSEIDRQCGFALMAYGDATTALQTRDSERLWYSLDALVSAAARLHRLLWPSPDGSLAWAVELRRVLGVPDDSPLNRPQLSAISNLVSTLEAWNALQPDQPPLLSNWGPGGFTEPTPAECVRCFAPESGTFTLLGTVLNSRRCSTPRSRSATG
jgi:hypothetical protein